MTDEGLVVIAAFMLSFRSEREMVSQVMEQSEFFEVFIDTLVSVVEGRYVKWLYEKARSGQLKNFTGIDSPYEVPRSRDIYIKTFDLTIDKAAAQILKNTVFKTYK